MKQEDFPTFDWKELDGKEMSVIVTEGTDSTGTVQLVSLYDSTTGNCFMIDMHFKPIYH